MICGLGEVECTRFRKKKMKNKGKKRKNLIAAKIELVGMKKGSLRHITV